MLADGAAIPLTEFADEALKTAERNGRAERFDYQSNFIYQEISRLRKILEKHFGADMRDRLVATGRPGFAWTPQTLLDQTGTFNPGKITYLPTLGRYFAGPAEVSVPARAHMILARLFNEKSKALSFQILRDLWESTFEEPTNRENVRMLLMRLNRNLSRATGLKHASFVRLGDERVDPDESAVRLNTALFEIR
ncbi:MAG: hypothetical protein HC902_10935 [Calothrix sp. SM1_5_4]|nr:hypothetical protein [Calothrix sp. SM1_5_4]